MANAKLNISTEERPAYDIPEPYWPEGQPHESWIIEPLIYTSPRVAQSYLDIAAERAYLERAIFELLDLGAELYELPEPGEPGEQLLLIDIPIRRYTKRFI